MKLELTQIMETEVEQIKAFENAQKVVENLKFNMDGIIDYAKNNCKVEKESHFQSQSQNYNSINSMKESEFYDKENESLFNNQSVDVEETNAHMEMNYTEKVTKPANYFKHHTKSYKIEIDDEENHEET